MMMMMNKGDDHNDQGTTNKDLGRTITSLYTKFWNDDGTKILTKAELVDSMTSLYFECGKVIIGTYLNLPDHFLLRSLNSEFDSPQANRFDSIRFDFSVLSFHVYVLGSTYFFISFSYFLSKSSFKYLPLLLLLFAFSMSLSLSALQQNLRDQPLSNLCTSIRSLISVSAMSVVVHDRAYLIYVFDLDTCAV